MTFIMLCAIFIVVSFGIYKAYKNTQEIKINKIKIDSNSNFPATQTLSILQISDMHLENISISPTELAQKLANEPIDIITLTGDFLDRKRTIPKLTPYLQVFNDLNPTYGIYAVLGNHDYVLKDDNLSELTDLLRQYNCKVMRNSSEVLSINGTLINIIGIDDYSTQRSNVPIAYQNVKFGTNIVLTHDPTLVLEMDNFRFDYLMAGHFHGGQICYPKAFHLAKMGKLARKNIIKGLHHQNNMPYYISEGLGQTGVNIRIGSRPEITFHEIAIHASKSNVV